MRLLFVLCGLLFLGEAALGRKVDPKQSQLKKSTRKMRKLMRGKSNGLAVSGGYLSVDKRILILVHQRMASSQPSITNISSIIIPVSLLKQRAEDVPCCLLPSGVSLDIPYSAPAKKPSKFKPAHHTNGGSCRILLHLYFESFVLSLLHVHFAG